jgi:hypothetical protein|tara:strand:+ start:729 stop:959 length:231 start_codon:yes stop_codon:yes gene_type:complete
MAPGRKKPLVKPEDAANLRVLQREDPEVEAILGSASHVTLYGFNLEEQAWVSAPTLSPTDPAVQIPRLKSNDTDHR